MKFLNEDKDMLNFVLSQLKVMGVKVPKMKKIKTSKQDKGPLKSNNKIFGACLAEQEGASGSNPPKFILSCTEYLQNHSKEIGLFRKAGSISRQKNLRVKIENGGSLDGSEPNDVASLLKQWLRELPEPLIPCYLHDCFIRCQTLNNESCITATLLLCLLLPPDHLHTLKHLMGFLADVATNIDKNKMSVENLALIMTPNIFVFGNNSVDKFSNIKVQQFTSVIQLLIENANKIGEIPPTLSLKLPIVEGKRDPESSSPCEVLEPSPSISRKQYLLRSFKKLVKQNTASVNSPVMGTPYSNSTLLRQTLPVNNIERLCLKSTVETKGNNNLFAPRNSDDVCKRSFRLLRRKDKRGPKTTMECHPFTQSLEIESTLNFQMEIDKDPLPLEESDIGNLLTANHFEDKVSGLEDIEMTTFSTHLNEQSNNLVAFPIPSSSQNLRSRHFFSELEREYNDKTHTKDIQSLQLNSANNNKKTDLPQEVGVVKLAEIPKDTGLYNCGNSRNNRNPHKTKSFKLAHDSCRVNEVVSAAVENTSNIQDNSYGVMKENNNSLSGDYSTTINKVSKSQMILPIVDSEIMQTSNAEVLNKKCSADSNAFKVLREGTFVIEPTQNAVNNKIKRPCIDDHKCKRIVKNIDKHEGHNNLSQKRQCTALNNKSKTRSKNPPIKRVSKKSVGTGKISVTKNKPSTRQSALQNTKHTIYVKGCSNLLDLDKKKEDSKILIDETISSSPLKTETQICKTQNALSSCLVKDTFSENAACLSQNSLETSLTSKRKLSFSRYPVTASRHSDSKIPRLKNSFEVSASNSFTEEATGHIRKVSKSKTSSPGEKPTKIPVRCNDSQNNLSTLELSINDSCFLTPNRNAMLSPNSVVWMSGNKYFTSNSPKEETFNKRESIAMILKSHSGHVQAKVHLYDDLIRESVDSTPTVPSHSTPTSKFRRLSSSQSMKSRPKQKTNVQSNKLVSSKTSLANRSHSLRNEKSLKAYDPPKFVTHTNTLSPIKSHSLKDVTNTSVVFNESKNSHSNFQTRDESVSDGNIRHPIKRRKPRVNSFSGNTARKSVKKVSRSESSPGCPRPFLRVECLIQE